MSDVAAKWNRTSRLYDVLTAAEHLRLEPFKQRLFARATGRVLFVGAGTGRDFALLPSGLDVLAIDVSPAMLARAQGRLQDYSGQLQTRVMSVMELDLPDGSFDTCVAACTFCSVSNPAAGLREVRRVLRPGGKLLLLEHGRSRLGPIAIMQDLFTGLTRRFGPDMNRDTVSTVLRVGFQLVQEENLYLDIIKAIEAVR